MDKRITFPNGLELYYSTSKDEIEYIYREIFIEQQYLRHGIVINQGDCIFDVGANIGFFSLFAKKLQPNLKIYAFEPIPINFAILEKNMRLHSVENVFLFNYGLSSENNPEKIFIFYPKMTGNSTSNPGHSLADINDIQADVDAEPVEDLFKHLFAEKQEIKCAIRTLSSVIAEVNIDSIELLKIDVEGEEYEVLKGIEAKDWKKIKQIVAEVHDKAGRLEKITTLLTDTGFSITVDKINSLPASYADVYNLYAVRSA